MPAVGAVSGESAALLGWVARATLAAVFALAGLHAMRHWAMFRAAVIEYRLGPAVLARAAGWALPPAEVAVAAALLVPATAWAGCAAGAALLLVFAAAMAANVARGRRDIDCGCGAADGQRLSWALVARNVALAAILGGAGLQPAVAFVGTAGGMAVGACALALVALYFAANQLVANRDALATWRSAA